ncbi:NAD-binding protein [Pantanalinema rosaneae CENA516]|uniref:NAD-binding protein n=1 Tax=Pantanalinema rosaneae TaxID=1620701 RepID=UPI003D6F5D60
MKPRIIVCGLNCTGYKIFCLLKQQGAIVTGIHAQAIPGEIEDIIVGDLRSETTLLAAGIRDAQTLILTDNEDGLNLAVLMQARVLNPRIRIVNCLFNTNLGDRLDRTLPEHITMSVAALAAPIFAFAALGNAAIGQLRLFNQTWPIHEECIDDNHPWLHRPLSDLWDDRDRMLIYYLPTNGQVNLVSAVLSNQVLQVGDRLIIGTKPNVRQAHQRSLSQRLSKLGMGLRYLQANSQALIGSTMLVLLVILISTLVYVSSILKASPIDALYFSVSMITGAGDSLINVGQTSDSLKLFTIFTMLVGAAIIGLSYALLNDFILGTRFDHFWEAIRVPQQHHFVVCGLGGVGVQIVNHLTSYGYDVVVIEKDPNCRFLSTVRSLKVPVIQGDASLPAILKAAHFEQSQGLLAVTSDDTANLEIALNAKSLNPKLPVIVRYQDPEFAWMAQLVFDFKAVLSPAELVSPAFAAAALGGRVLGNGMTAGSLWVALATLITPSHPFCGKRVQEMAIGADFVPLYLETRSQTIHGWDLLQVSLSAGDVLYLTIPASELEQLWQPIATARYAKSAQSLVTDNFG